jgi:pyrimidine deaminase RibD-like protein
LDDVRFMREAIEQARMSAKRQRGDPKFPPSVGVIVANEKGTVIARAYRSETVRDAHAEFIALEEKLKGVRLQGATLYTTLEPCIDVRSAEKVGCAERVAESGVSEVVVGMFDPNIRVCARGWLYLQRKGVRLRRFPEELEREVRELNASFIEDVSNVDRPRLVGRRRKKRAPVLGFVDDLTPDPISVHQLARACGRGRVTVEIGWPSTNDSLWHRVLRERAGIVERLRLGVPGGDDPREAASDFAYVDQAIDFAWRVRTGAATRVPKIWKGVKGISDPVPLRTFERVVIGFLTVCNMRVLQSLYRRQRAGTKPLFPLGDSWAKWERDQTTKVYRSAFRSDEEFATAIVLSVGGRIFDLRVYAPRREIEAARQRYVSRRARVYADFVLPQIEFEQIGKRDVLLYRDGMVWEPRLSD